MEKTDVYYDYEGGQRKRKTRITGNKIEIDAVKTDQGSEGLWDYMLEQLGERYPNRDYTRVIDAHHKLPPFQIGGYKEPPIIEQVNSYLKDRVEEITTDRVAEYNKELQDYEGFLVVTEKKKEIENELGEIVNGDQLLKDTKSVLSSVATSVEKTITDAVFTAIEKLDKEKGYGIMEALRGPKIDTS